MRARSAISAGSLPRALRLSDDELARLDRVRWSHDEIETFSARYRRLVDVLRMRGEDANDIAEALLLRDRDGDDRRHCCECEHIRIGGCARRSLNYTAARLQRCPAFLAVEVAP